MPITKGAKKAHRSSLRKYVYNLRRKRAMRSAIKFVRDAVARGEMTAASAHLPNAYKAIDKAAKRGVIKKNTASRTKSRLVRAVGRAQAAK